MFLLWIPWKSDGFWTRLSHHLCTQQWAHQAPASSSKPWSQARPWWKSMGQKKNKGHECGEMICQGDGGDGAEGDKRGCELRAIGIHYIHPQSCQGINLINKNCFQWILCELLWVFLFVNLGTGDRTILGLTILFYIYACFARFSICALLVCPVLIEVGRGHQLSGNLNCGWLWTIRWVLGTKPQFSAGPTSALRHWAVPFSSSTKFRS